MMDQKINGATHYFVDFDHTISTIDVWDSLIRICNPQQWRTVINDYVSGKISSRVCNLELAQSITLSEEEAREIVSKIGIDSTFHDFVQWAEQNQSPLMILSDGYDFYIDQLLQSEGLDSIPVFSNRMTWTDEGIQVEFPLYKKDCERDMAHCKCQHVRRADSGRRVYIGDGVSDSCAASKCDFVYAKRNLLEYCREHRIRHEPFDNFQDVIRHEKILLNKNRANAGAHPA
ncbi:MAG: MtnX-like HAD-IB family phosphatase [Candidatus Omnitrophica bacterium]|nr:MtnX-like HAD-IB family phosphatase [Candidatus Omnitrophota bacterium]